MKTLKILGVLFVSLILQSLLLPFRLTIFILRFIEKVIEIIRTTIEFLMKSIQSEVLKTFNNENRNQKE